jgi:hypothetical protein
MLKKKFVELITNENKFYNQKVWSQLQFNSLIDNENESYLNCEPIN